MNIGSVYEFVVYFLGNILVLMIVLNILLLIFPEKSIQKISDELLADRISSLRHRQEFYSKQLAQALAEQERRARGTL